MKLNSLRQGRTQIVIEGKLLPEDIDCLYASVRIPFDDHERSYIEKGWNNEITKEPSIFDAKLFHVKKRYFLQSRLLLDTCMSSFKEWVGTKSNIFKESFGEDRFAKPLSVGTMIVTADKKWIIGRREKTYDYEDRYTLVAGYMDPDMDIVNSKPDPFFAIKREIEEETGINQKHDIDSVMCLGLDGIDQPYLAFSTTLKVPYKELIYNMPKEKEFINLEAYDYKKRSIEGFVTSNYTQLTPHTLANILMSYKLVMSK
jgi:8-oxo-dGTP pyrophosphatase MutT (NUDIX family)